MKKILVVGSMNMDLVTKTNVIPKIGETIIGQTFYKVPGGKGANQAVAVSKLKGNVCFLGKVGNDDFGKKLINNMKNNGISTNGIKKSLNEPTGLASILVDAYGNNSIVVIPGANYDLVNKDIDDSIFLIKEADIIILQLEIPLEIINYVIQIAKNKIIILNPAPAQILKREMLNRIDYLIPNETELEMLCGKSLSDQNSYINASKEILKMGVKNIIVTLGEKGVLSVNKRSTKFFPSFKVKAIDSTAAGDSFIAGFAVGLAQGKSIEDSIVFGTKVGALTVTKNGAQSSLPELSDVLNFNGGS